MLMAAELIGRFPKLQLRWHIRKMFSLFFLEKHFLVENCTLSVAMVSVSCITLYGRCQAKTCLRAYADSEAPDQTAHMRSLIRAFTVL